MEDVDPQSGEGDFMVLDSTTREGATGPSGADAERRMKERSAEIERLCEICGPDDGQGTRRPLRMVVVGKHGAGKSSFINCVAAALSEDRWREYAYTGDLGKGAPITIVNQRHVKCCNGHLARYREVLLPSLIDVAGLGDELDDKMEELLRLLFYGHIEEDEAVMTVYEECQRSSSDEIRKKYSRSYSGMRVDRVVFVASAADPLPDRLMNCVLRAARPSHYKDVRRAVPIYGVLTKRDKVDTTSTAFLDTRKKFMQELGLNQSRFLLCSNYCDDLDPQGLRTRQLSPDLDLPAINFLQQLCDRALKVIREDEVLPGSETTKEEKENAQNAERQAWGLLDTVKQEWQSLDVSYQDCITSAVVGVVTLLAVFVVLPPSGHGDARLQEACQSSSITDATFKSLRCQELSPWSNFRQVLVQMLLAFLISAGFFVYRRANRTA